jgi:RNA 3'-terminal phosphate cyclase-like protein
MAVSCIVSKSEIGVMLLGITNDTKDSSVDTFRTTLHMLKHFGVPLEGLELNIDSRGSPPLGDGEVFLRVTNINCTLTVCFVLISC